LLVSVGDILKQEQSSKLRSETGLLLRWAKSNDCALSWLVT